MVCPILGCGGEGKRTCAIIDKERITAYKCTGEYSCNLYDVIEGF